MEDALYHPLTSVPLALASPDGDLRQGSKAALRNHLILDPEVVSNDIPTNSKWIFDGELLYPFLEDPLPPTETKSSKDKEDKSSKTFFGKEILRGAFRPVVV